MQVTQVNNAIIQSIKHIMILTVQILLAPLWIAIGIIVGWRLCHPRRYQVKGTPKKYNMNYHDVSFMSNDQSTTLKGWYIKSDAPKATIIFSHGYLGNRTKYPNRSLDLAKFYRNNGFDILMFDYRNCGASEGNKSTVGIHEQDDLIGAIDFVKEHNPHTNIVLIGWSTGGSSAIMAAKERNVDVIITDSAFHNLEDYLIENLTKWTKLPSFINPFIMLTFPLVCNGLHPRMSKPIHALKHIDCPIFFIHSEKDSTIPHNCTMKMFDKYNGIKKLWITRKGDHVKNHLSNREYCKTTLSFINKAIKK
ncbi:alpha/beta hydrolase [Salirhabdus salicampi]|uniref:alpha/beta hydrolase n=1 Tax=Salirhabdus salicampi TaxID=476102 RepID=UPI0020C4E8EA|nr:alpha/beta hydrolase [Salirhabdus salicampi]MCP8616247.1 alpha/beta hydrolase [Salirhabdus salicampi]